MKIKRKVFVSIAMAFFVLTLLAAAAFAMPQTISYQGRLAESGGAPVNGPVSMTFAIYNAPSGGSALWTETQSNVTVTDGAFSVVLGSVTPITLAFDEQYYLGVNVDGDGEMSPRAVLLSVPYSMRAKEADSADTAISADTADLLDGQDSTAFAASAHGHSGADITDGTVTGAKLSEPLSLSRSSGAPIVSSTNTGGGQAGSFQIMNSFSSNHALMASTNGFGSAVYGSTSGIGYAVYGYTTGMGRAGHFEINKSGNSQPALSAQTNGSGNAIYGLTTSTGNAGNLEINNAANSSNALYAETNGSGDAVYGTTSGSGTAVRGYTTGAGSGAGRFEIWNTSNTKPALYATSSGSGEAIYGYKQGSGSAIYGYTIGMGRAGHFQINQTLNTADALEATTNGSGNAIYSYTNGSGRAGYFHIDNIASSAEVLEATTNGGGTAVYGHTTGSSSAGFFRIDNAASGAHALVGQTYGTGYSGYFSGGAGVYVSGNLNVTGTITGELSGDNHNHDADYVNVTGDSMTGTLNISTSTTNAVYGTTSGSGHAVYGYTTGTGRPGLFRINNAASNQTALEGWTNGTGYAVYGYTTGTNRAGYFEINNTANPWPALHAHTNGSNHAVYGETTGTSGAGRFLINNAVNGSSALYVSTNGNGYSGYFTGGAGVNVSGNLNVTGTLTKSAGSFVQPHPTDPSKELVYAFFEGPEHAVFLRGTGRLVDGKAVIDTPEHFRAVAGEEGITVQFTPRFENTIGLAAVEVTKERIVVKERMGGNNSYEFDYFITAKRAGFESHEPIQPNTHFTADMKTAEEFEEAYAKNDMTISAMRKLLVSNGILTADGKLNMELARELGWVVKDSDVAVK